MNDTAEVPALTPEAIRTLLRDHLTVVKPGETLVMRPAADISPNQWRELQDMLDAWHSQGDLPFRVIALPAAEFVPTVSDPGGGTLTFEFQGKGWTGTPVVNGYPVYSAEVIDVHISAEEVPTVTLRLIAPDGLRLALSRAEVCVADETREALVSLGWTPPEEGA